MDDRFRRDQTASNDCQAESQLIQFMGFLRERVVAFPDLSAARLTREIRELGYAGAYTAVKRFLAAIRPENGPKPYEVRFETPPGVQAQVDFARFVVDFTDDPDTSRVVWLFSLVLGHSRFLFARYVLHQTCKRCCGAISRPSRRSAACRSRSSTTA
jgi:transposase